MTEEANVISIDGTEYKESKTRFRAVRTCVAVLY